jgi:chemotaxis protein CheD
MRQNYLDLAKYFLRPGYIFVPGKPTLISVVLGSCVAVSLWDKKLEYGGMNHFLYPRIADPDKATAQYGNVATHTLIRLFLGSGSRVENLEAQILGGACQGNGGGDRGGIPQQNIDVAMSLVQNRGIRIASQDVGGNKGRKAIYNSQTNELMVIRVERLRECDWYPYLGER